MNGQSIEALLSAAKRDDWGGLNELMAQFGADPQKREAQARDKAAQEARRAKYLAALAAVFSTDEGALVLDELCDGTLRRIAFHTQIGIDPRQALLNGAFREGQNSVVAALLKDLAEVLGDAFPPAKETEHGWRNLWQRYRNRRGRRRG